MVEKDDLERKKRSQEKEERKSQRAQHTEALVEWKQLEAARKARSEEKKSAYQTAVKAWEEEHDLAKHEHCRPQWTRPKFGGCEKALPQPKIVEETLEEEVEDDGGVLDNNDVMID